MQQLNNVTTGCQYQDKSLAESSFFGPGLPGWEIWWWGLLLLGWEIVLTLNFIEKNCTAGFSFELYFKLFLHVQLKYPIFWKIFKNRRSAGSLQPKLQQTMPDPGGIKLQACWTGGQFDIIVVILHSDFALHVSFPFIISISGRSQRLL